jgi:hypothetical protein
VPHHDEIVPLLASGFDEASAWVVVAIAGYAEILIGLTVLVCWQQRWPLLLTAVAMVVAITGVAVTAPGMFLSAFNPLTISTVVGLLALVAWLLQPWVPSARRCRRRRATETKT